jgi:hypothetical protein
MISMMLLCALSGNLLRWPVELGAVNPHPVQNDGKLSSDGDLALRSPLRFATPMPQALSTDHVADLRQRLYAAAVERREEQQHEADERRRLLEILTDQSRRPWWRRVI